MISVNFSLFEEYVATVIDSIPISGKVLHSLTEQMIGFINLQFHQKDEVLKPISTQLSGQKKSPKKRLAPAGKRQTSQPKAIYKPTQMTESSTIASRYCDNFKSKPRCADQRDPEFINWRKEFPVQFVSV